MTEQRLSSAEQKEVFERCAALVRVECSCHPEKQCIRCFDLLQIFRIHRGFLVEEFHALARRAGEWAGVVDPNRKGE